MQYIDINTFIPSYTEVVPGLWLGNEAASQDADFIRNAGIRLIINCTKKAPNKFASSLGYINYVRLSINDPGPLVVGSRNQDNIDMITLIPYAAHLIHQALQRGESVLVHCHAGAQRSASVVVYYLMQYGKFALGPDYYRANLADRKRAKYEAVKRYLVSKRPFVYYGGTHNNFRYAMEQILGVSLS